VSARGGARRRSAGRALRVHHSRGCAAGCVVTLKQRLVGAACEAPSAAPVLGALPLAAQRALGWPGARLARLALCVKARAKGFLLSWRFWASTERIAHCPRMRHSRPHPPFDGSAPAPRARLRPHACSRRCSARRCCLHRHLALHNGGRAPRLCPARARCARRASAPRSARRRVCDGRGGAEPDAAAYARFAAQRAGVGGVSAAARTRRCTEPPAARSGGSRACSVHGRCAAPAVAPGAALCASGVAACRLCAGVGARFCRGVHGAVQRVAAWQRREPRLRQWRLAGGDARPRGALACVRVDRVSRGARAPRARCPLRGRIRRLRLHDSRVRLLAAHNTAECRTPCSCGWRLWRLTPWRCTSWRSPPDSLYIIHALREAGGDWMHFWTGRRAPLQPPPTPTPPTPASTVAPRGRSRKRNE
jgi:hypothetical protein